MRKLLGCIAIIFLLISCDTNGVYDQYKSVPNAWHKDSIVQFQISNVDSTQLHTMYITMRNTYEYPYSNLFLITEFAYPNGRNFIDTLEYKMANPQGALLGEGFSDIKESKLWYKEGVRFRESGTYNLSIRHAMRRNGKVNGDTQLNGVTDIGLRIERQNL